MRCINCGKELPEGATVCDECGAAVPTGGFSQPADPDLQPVDLQPAAAQPTVAQPVVSGGQDKVVGTWAFFGLKILFAIPIIGWIACLVMAFVSKNKNIRHFAAASIIYVVLSAICSVGLFFGARFFILNYFNEELGLEYESLTELFEDFSDLLDYSDYMDYYDDYDYGDFDFDSDDFSGLRDYLDNGGSISDFSDYFDDDYEDYEDYEDIFDDFDNFYDGDDYYDDEDYYDDDEDSDDEDYSDDEDV